MQSIFTSPIFIDRASTAVANAILREQRKPMTDEQKAVFWRAFDKRTEEIQAEFKPQLVKLFKAQEADVIKRVGKYRAPKSLRKADDDALYPMLFDSDDWETRFSVVGEKVITAGFVEAGQERIAELVIGIDFDIQNPRAQEFLKKKIPKFSFDVNNTTSKQLLTEFRTGMKLGEGIPELRKRVTKVYGFAEKVRTERIARTEVIGAYNSGYHEGMVQSGVVKEKEWIATLDDRVRDSHKALNRQVRLLDKPYSNGLMHPGDHRGPPEEIINCRCTESAHSFYE